MSSFFRHYANGFSEEEKKSVLNQKELLDREFKNKISEK